MNRLVESDEWERGSDRVVPGLYAYLRNAREGRYELSSGETRAFDGQRRDCLDSSGDVRSRD